MAELKIVRRFQTSVDSEISFETVRVVDDEDEAYAAGEQDSVMIQAYLRGFNDTPTDS